MKKILIVDDDVAVTNYFLVFLTQTERFESTIINDARQVPGLLKDRRFDVILLDLDMPHVSGVDILKLMQEQAIRTPVVVLTGVGDVDLAVKAMKFGAFDYLTKPAEEAHLLEVLDQAVEHESLHRTLTELPPEPRREDLIHGAAFEEFISQDPKMIRLLHEAEKMAAGDMTVFIIGERGTGREALARAMHQISSRRSGPFVAVDVSAEAQDVFPAMLFGQARAWQDKAEERKGLLETATGGTLFLDHVEHLAIPTQLKLKRVIQTGKYYRENSTQVMTADMRLIIASTDDLSSPSYQGPFSRELLYHLTINTLRIPPLRERRGDIPLLVADALRLEAAKTGKKIDGLDADVVDFLSGYPFPGNDRELRTAAASSVLRCEGERIRLDDLPPCLREPQGCEEPHGARAFAPKRLADVEREYVVQMLQHCGGDKEKAAAELGVTVRQMESILEESPGTAPGDGRKRKARSK